MNPFSYGAVVKEPYFFNRTEEVRRIVDTLGGGNNLVLYAPRRYGKTSVVMKAIEALRAQGFVCIYFDFMTVYSRESFIEAFSRAVLTSQGNFSRAAQTFSKFVKGIRPKIAFDPSGAPEFSVDFSAPEITDQSLESVLDLPDKLASEIWQRCINRVETVNDEIIAACADSILDLKGDYYFELFDRQTAYQKKLLKALAADGQNVFSAEYAVRFRLSAASTTQKALNGLVNSGIVEKYQNAYTFGDPFFKRYLLRLPA
jgi:AAA+ ATPase superfamily predicted ATPase